MANEYRELTNERELVAQKPRRSQSPYQNEITVYLPMIFVD